MASLAEAIDVNPLLLMIPATLAASCAFMLPVSTPPNAIVYGSDRVPIIQMIKAGVVMDVVGLILIVATTFTMGAVVFGLTGGVPDWALAPPQ
jgi:sodium-dependent dicarboxylate transporter 2/3/5